MPELLTLTPDELSAAIPAFQDLSPAVPAWLLAEGEVRRYADSEVIIEPGSPAEFLTAVVTGAMQIYAQRHGQREPVFRSEAGQVGGVLPYSRLQVIQGQVVAVGETTLYVLHRQKFPALEQVSPELVQRLVSVMSDRARDEARTQERDDKLRALGKLAAGLAHELNNPAAAIARAADALAARAQAKPHLLQGLLVHCPSPEAVAALAALAEGKKGGGEESKERGDDGRRAEGRTPEATAGPDSANPSSSPPPPLPSFPKTLSALECADREDELADWLETQGVPDGYQLAAGLLEADLSVEKLAPVAALLPAEARPAAFAWLEGQLTTLHLVRDVREAGQRISTLVGNVKTYSHMDRDAGRELLDVTQGLDSTLNIFAYALRHKNVKLARRYADNLPRVRGQVSSLNQVWTNLIDNALDALPERGGELTLSAQKQNDFVCVSVQDNGAGIPADVLVHIFEPFYTTKPAGEGTGLGLDIARRIVQQHGGRLEAKSEPGRTEFTAWLPAFGGEEERRG